MPPPTRCICQIDDCIAAQEAIRRARSDPGTDFLVDQSHFIVSIRRCRRPLCGQSFLTIFCERVDWADSDDPQTWLAVPITAEEAGRLRLAGIDQDEDALLRILTGERRFLFNDRPKGAPATLEWKQRTLFIPAHD